MIEEDKTRKYLFYAVGEIALVVIGILIALQVNNWNEKRRDATLRDQMILALQAEFTDNLEQVNFILSKHQLVEKSIHHSLEIMEQQASVVSLDSLETLIRYLQFNYTFDPRNGALRTAISSGNIHLLQDPELKTLLFEWEDGVADLNEDELISREYVNQNRDIFYRFTNRLNTASIAFDDIRKSKFPSRYDLLFEDKKFEDFLAFRILGVRSNINEIETVRSHNMQILDALNTLQGDQ
jgi:hypothetical protein